MCAEHHCASIHTWNDLLHRTAVQKMLDGIVISCFDRNSHTNIFPIRDFIFCIIFQIPKLKFVGFKQICLCFITKFIVLATCCTELYIPRKVDSRYRNTVAGMVCCCKFDFFFIGRFFICHCLCTLIRSNFLLSTIKNIVFIGLRCFGNFRCFRGIWCICNIWCSCNIRCLCSFWCSRHFRILCIIRCSCNFWCFCRICGIFFLSVS